MSDEKDAEPTHEVGYGKPPKHTQWQKGQSGNPSGKKKKKESLYDLLKTLAGEEIVVHQNGVPVTMTKTQAMLAATLHKAMSGNLGSTKFIFEKLAAIEAGLSETKTPALTKDLLSVLETHADWVGMVEAALSELAEANDGQDDGGNDDNAY